MTHFCIKTLLLKCFFSFVRLVQRLCNAKVTVLFLCQKLQKLQEFYSINSLYFMIWWFLGGGGLRLMIVIF